MLTTSMERNGAFARRTSLHRCSNNRQRHIMELGERLSMAISDIRNADRLWIGSPAPTPRFAIDSRMNSPCERSQASGIVRMTCERRLHGLSTTAVANFSLFDTDDRTFRAAGREAGQRSQLRGFSPWWSAITPPKYSAKNTKETETILTKAPEAPNAVAKCGMALMIRAVPKPATTDAAKNFQMTANIGPIPSPIGFPAYQKPGNIRRKYETVQAKAIPEGPQRKASKNRLAVHANSIKPQRNHLSGRPIER